MGDGLDGNTIGMYQDTFHTGMQDFVVCVGCHLQREPETGLVYGTLFQFRLSLIWRPVKEKRRIFRVALGAAAAALGFQFVC